jgi:hypothetical protein
MRGLERRSARRRTELGADKTATAQTIAIPTVTGRPASDHADVLDLVAFHVASDLELDALDLFQRLVSVALDRREMHEQVVALLAR